MGMSASTLRLTMLTARLSQLQFQGQQINQQRTMLSNESSAMYNSILTAEVPTAPDPAQFTRIKYKSGNTSIINYAQNASGPYSHNMTIRRPATKSVMSQSSYNNINLTRSVDSEATDYNFIANINGVNRTLSLVGGEDAKTRLQAYESKLDTYETMQTIESQITDLSKEDQSKTVSTQTQQDIKNALGFSFDGNGIGENDISTALTELMSIDTLDLSGVSRPSSSNTSQYAYDLMKTFSDPNYTKKITEGNFYELINEGNTKTRLEGQLLTKLNEKASTFEGSSQELNMDIFQDLNELEMKALQNALCKKAGNTTEWEQSKYGVTDQQYSNYVAAKNLFNISTGDEPANYEVTNEEMINTLKALLTQVGGGNASAAAYYTNEVEPAYNAYQSSCATPGLTNVGQGETLFTYKDDNGDDAYIYLPIEDISEDIFQTTIDTAKVYENQVSYIEGETVAETVNANVTFDEDGLMTKATLDTGEVLTFEVETELDETAYNAAMVQYEYQVQKYEKELSDANAKLAKIQAQDQKLEVQLTQLETEQKAVQTEIDAVKAVRDKSIERGFRTFS